MNEWVIPTVIHFLIGVWLVVVFYLEIGESSFRIISNFCPTNKNIP